MGLEPAIFQLRISALSFNKGNYPVFQSRMSVTRWSGPGGTVVWPSSREKREWDHSLINPSIHRGVTQTLCWRLTVLTVFSERGTSLVCSLILLLLGFRQPSIENCCSFSELGDTVSDFLLERCRIHRSIYWWKIGTRMSSFEKLDLRIYFFDFPLGVFPDNVF